MPQYKDGKKFVRKRGTYIGNAKRRAEVKSMSKGPLKKPTSIKPTSIKPTSIKPPLGKPNSVKNLLPLANLNNAISGSNTVTNIKKYIVKRVKGSSDNSVLGVPLETSVKAGEKIAKNLKNTVNSGRNLYGAITEKSNAERMKGDLTKGISLFKYITGIANAKINKPKNKYEERKNRPVVSSEEYKKQYKAAIDPSFKEKLRRKMKSNDSIKYRFNGKFTD